MKEFAIELWTVMRQAVASVLCAIGCSIGLPGLVFTKVADMFIEASTIVAGIHKDDSEDEDTELVYT